jgi:hypothetical protein
MKIFRISFLVLLTATIGVFSACNKNADEIIALISESEAADMIEVAVSDRVAGVTLPTVDMAQIVENYLQNCGQPGDTTLVKSNSAGNNAYNYSFDIDWLVNCTALGIPEDADIQIAGTGSFNTLRWSGTDNTTGALTLGGISPAASMYSLNGAYQLTGTLSGNLRRVDPILNAVIDLQLNDLNIDKTTYKITSGTGTATITVSNGQGSTQTLTGELQFNTNGTVTITVNGHSHTF